LTLIPARRWIELASQFQVDPKLKRFVLMAVGLFLMGLICLMVIHWLSRSILHN
jgi:phage shock protein PspC (stress-responsive transcriptional regulator)